MPKVCKKVSTHLAWSAAFVHPFCSRSAVNGGQGHCKARIQVGLLQAFQACMAEVAFFTFLSSAKHSSVNSFTFSKSFSALSPSPRICLSREGFEAVQSILPGILEQPHVVLQLLFVGHLHLSWPNTSANFPSTTSKPLSSELTAFKAAFAFL